MLLLAMTLIAADVEPAPQPMVVEIVRDAMTDEVRAHAILRQRGDRLVISCDPARYRGARVTFHSRRWLAPASLVLFDEKLMYRIDDQPPQQSMWRIRHRRAELYREARAAAFVNELTGARRLAIRTRDIENRRFDTVFDLPDVRPAIDQAMNACGGWPVEEDNERRFWPF
ncbi:MAG: hypothetical protein ACT4OE_07605 [Sphingosinicella sp.]